MSDFSAFFDAVQEDPFAFTTPRKRKGGGKHKSSSGKGGNGLGKHPRVEEVEETALAREDPRPQKQPRYEEPAAGARPAGDASAEGARLLDELAEELRRQGRGGSATFVAAQFPMGGGGGAAQNEEKPPVITWRGEALPGEANRTAKLQMRFIEAGFLSDRYQCDCCVVANLGAEQDDLKSEGERLVWQAFSSMHGNTTLSVIWDKMSTLWNTHIFDKNYHRLKSKTQLTPMTPLRMEFHCRQHLQRVILLLKVDEDLETTELMQTQLWEHHMWRREYIDDEPTEKWSADSRHLKDWREASAHKINLIKLKVSLAMGLGGNAMARKMAGASQKDGKLNENTARLEGSYKAPGGSRPPIANGMPVPAAATNVQRGIFKGY